ncbi:ethylene-responsive family protein [Hibiscus syriacus]|uniref:Ethylene-responsive family protein n=1 Tax=Hibiscus syriacus TaxID=106335 RepID=A0A6A3CSW7_HIBSY|nr:transcriptional regulator DEF1-like [Hibiscus syriacus]XP_039035739.1 transcriptional regulator DEF1-like [Hibiscus syriacus]KAE8730329.1 ethylene-responsive family protein [Hibiscus syriacus]
MASGSSGRGNSGGSKVFDFGSDDILCSYEDYGNQESSNGNHAEPNSSDKEFHRVARSVFPPSGYSQPEDSYASDLNATVEKTMKRYTDNLMRFLEGISSRLSQLELYCYKLDRSIGEMRADLVRGNGDADSKLKSIEKHLQEVHRSVQILRDKQELAETQKELAKLQLAQKESSSSHSQSTEERVSNPAPNSKKSELTSEIQTQQLALALPHQIASQQQPVAPPSQALSQNLTQQSYYMPSNQVSTPQAPAAAPSPAPTQAQPPAQAQHPQNQYLTSDPQYRPPQIQDMSRMPPQPTQSQVNQVQSFPQYQQQWPQQLSQQVPPQQQSSMQPQMRPPSTPAYPSYPPTQSTNPSQPEALPNSMPMQVSYSGLPQPVSSSADTIPYGYGVPSRTTPQQPPQQIKGTFGVQPSDRYTGHGSNPPFPQGNAYMTYDSEAGRTHHPFQQPNFSQGGYPPSNASLQTQSGSGPNIMVGNPNHSQFVHNHPYSELIEKLVSMGFRSDHVVSVIHRMEESGQPPDFNAVLDRLNVQSSGGSQRGGW